MFRVGDICRHRHCLDIDVEIKKVQYRGPDYWELKVAYWNRHYKFVMAMKAWKPLKFIKQIGRNGKEYVL